MKLKKIEAAISEIRPTKQEIATSDFIPIRWPTTTSVMILSIDIEPIIVAKRELIKNFIEILRMSLSYVPDMHSKTTDLIRNEELSSFKFLIHSCSLNSTIHNI
jgi:hypothetical protein